MLAPLGLVSKRNFFLSAQDELLPGSSWPLMGQSLARPSRPTNDGENNNSRRPTHNRPPGLGDGRPLPLSQVALLGPPLLSSPLLPPLGLPCPASASLAEDSLI